MKENNVSAETFLESTAAHRNGEQNLSQSPNGKNDPVTRGFAGNTLLETSEGRITLTDLYEQQESGKALPRVFAFHLARGLPALVEILGIVQVGHGGDRIELTTDKGIAVHVVPRQRILLYGGACRAAEDLRGGERLRKLSRGTNPHRSDRRMIYTKVNDSGEYQSRWMYEPVHGPIPASMHLHHINGDPTDDRLSNFELVPKEEHFVHHATGKNNPRFIDCEMALKLRVYDFIMENGRQRGGVVAFSLGRWNRAVEVLGLKGQVPLVNPKDGGRVQGRPWKEFAREIEEAASKANDRVLTARRIEAGRESAVFSLRLPTRFFPFVSDGRQLHALAVAGYTESSDHPHAQLGGDRPPVPRAGSSSTRRR
jgi:hypothetical protein